jgi:hypothetical protein
MTTHKPKDALDQARSAFRTGNYAEALKQYEYFFDHAMEDEEHNYYGVRLSYCLDEWARLADKYPAAIDRLEKKRDEALSLLAQTRNPERFHDYQSICKYLKSEKLPIDKFLVYHSSDPELAKTVFRFIKKDLAKAEFWNICSTYINKPLDEYNLYLQTLDMALKIHEEEGWDNSIVKSGFVRDVSNLLLILKNTEKSDEVASLQNSILSDMQSRNLPELATDISQRAGLI